MHSLIIKDKAFYKKLATIAVPIALQGLITTGVNMMDNVMVANLGEAQLSGVSLANQFINIFHIFCMGIGMGASVLVARYYGMKDGSSLKKTLSIMLRLCAALSVIFSVATLLWPGMIMRIYTKDPAFIGYGVEYLNYSIITYIFLGLSVTCTIVLRNIDQVRIPLYTSIGAFFVNIGANYIFIYGIKFGDKVIFESMGVPGAALGTLVARLFEFSIICGFLFFKDKKIGFRLRDIFRPVGVIWKEYIRISIPVLISDGILALGNNSVAMVIGRLDSGFVAANTVTTITQQLSSVMIQGFSQAGAIVTGHTLGEGDRKKAFEQGYAFLGVGILFGALAAGIILLISEPMLILFNLEPETKSIARELMLSISIIILFQATNSIMTKGVLRGGGDTKMLVVADNIFMWAAALPLGILAGLVFHLPAFWIYFALKFDQVLKAVWCVYRLQSGKWIKRIRSDNELLKEKAQK
ncbi:MAG: MATE family efflux transporter [Clostridia bacterium]|nr:MATE family efflux transporter [Clostridia bacterium]